MHPKLINQGNPPPFSPTVHPRKLSTSTGTVDDPSSTTKFATTAKPNPPPLARLHHIHLTRYHHLRRIRLLEAYLRPHHRDPSPTPLFCTPPNPPQLPSLARSPLAPDVHLHLTRYSKPTSGAVIGTRRLLLYGTTAK